MTDPELLVHGEVLDRLMRIPGRPWEVGGWLLGWWSDDGSETLVTHATPPASRGTPFGVTISGRGHRPMFDAAWNASGGTVTFLGDWHTHPGGPAAVSERDRKAMRQLASDPDFGTSRLRRTGAPELPLVPRPRAGGESIPLAIIEPYIVNLYFLQHERI